MCDLCEWFCGFVWVYKGWLLIVEVFVELVLLNWLLECDEFYEVVGFVMEVVYGLLL